MFRKIPPLPVILLAASCQDPSRIPPPKFPPQTDPYVNSDPYGPSQPQQQTSPAPNAPGYLPPVAPEPSYDSPSSPTTPPPTVAPAPSQGEYPVAERSTQAGQVKSPYPPHKIIDVSSFKSGQLARDPWNQKIFRVP